MVNQCIDTPLSRHYEFMKAYLQTRIISLIKDTNELFQPNSPVCAPSTQLWRFLLIPDFGVVFDLSGKYYWRYVCHNGEPT